MGRDTKSIFAILRERVAMFLYARTVTALWDVTHLDVLQKKSAGKTQIN